MSISESDTVASLTRKLVQAIVDRFMSDGDYRKRLLADPEAMLRSEGLDSLFDLIAKLKAADPDAVEAGIQSGEDNPSC